MPLDLLPENMTLKIFLSLGTNDMIISSADAQQDESVLLPTNAGVAGTVLINTSPLFFVVEKSEFGFILSKFHVK